MRDLPPLGGLRAHSPATGTKLNSNKLQLTYASLPHMQIRCQRVIYHLMEDVSALLVGASPKQEVEVVAGTADVLALFPLKGAR